MAIDTQDAGARFCKLETKRGLNRRRQSFLNLRSSANESFNNLLFPGLLALKLSGEILCQNPCK